MITIDLIRHAESEMNVAMADPTREPFIGGRQNEIELSVVGESQAVKLGQYAVSSGIRPDYIYSSPAVRCTQTAAISSRVMGHGLEIIKDDRLQELDQGTWTNQPRSLYDDPFNKEMMKRLEGDFAPVGGESMNDVQRRIDACLTEIALRHEDGSHIWVYTHGVAIKTWVGHQLGWSHTQTYKKSVGNTSLTRALSDGVTWSVPLFSHSPL